MIKQSRKYSSLLHSAHQQKLIAPISQTYIQNPSQLYVLNTRQFMFKSQQTQSQQWNTEFQRSVYISKRNYGLFDKLFKKSVDKPVVKENEDEKVGEIIIEEETPIEVQAESQQEEVEESEEEEAMQDFSDKEEPSYVPDADMMGKIDEREQTIEKLADQEATKIEYSSHQNNLKHINELLGKTPKLLNNVTSQIDYVDDIKIKDDGTIVHNVFKNFEIKKVDKKNVQVESGPKTWKSISIFKRWRTLHLGQRLEHIRDQLSPLQFYVTQGEGHERPFTGTNWWTKDVGTYSCVNCTQNLFMSDHKYENKSGYPTFWNHVIDAVDFKNDKLTRPPEYAGAFEDPVLKNKLPVQRVVCSCCESTAGFVYDDGPAPFFKRFQVNDAAIVFTAKPYFEIPMFSKEVENEQRKLKLKHKKGQGSFLKLHNDEEFMGIPPLAERQANKRKASKMRVQEAIANKVDEKESQSSEPTIQFDVKGVPQPSQQNKDE